MKRGFFWLCALVLTVLASGAGHPPEMDVALRVDLGKPMGELPYLFRAGVFNGNVVPQGYHLEKFVTDLKPGAVEFYLAHTTIRPSTDMRDLERRLREWDLPARKIAAKGGEIVVEIAAMPSWLTSNLSRNPVNPAIGDYTPVGSLSPPKDYDVWARMVGVIVNHFNNKLGIKAKYTIWGEPDIVWWQGTEAEYFKLYRYSVLGAKRADRNAKIGGPAVSHWRGKKGKTNNPLIYNFIRYASQTALPALGLKRLPIDFINWHQYNANPLDPESFGEPVRTVKRWLKEFGYSEDTEVLIGEWDIWQYFGKEHGFSNEEHDNEINASYIVSALIAMDAAGVTRHSYSYLIDSVPGREFIGDFGLLTKRGIIKASFNAFKAVSQLEGQRIWVDHADPTVRAIAAKKDGRISLLISNFVPWGPMLESLFPAQLRARGYTKADAERFKRSGLSKEKLQDVLAGKSSLDDVDLPQKFKQDLKEILSLVRQNLVRRNQSVRVRVNFQDGDKRSHRYEKYTIDATHSNSYALRNKIGDPGNVDVREINDRPGVRLEKVDEGSVRSLRLLPDIIMPPYSVVLLVLTPS